MSLTSDFHYLSREAELSGKTSLLQSEERQNIALKCIKSIRSLTGKRGITDLGISHSVDADGHINITLTAANGEDHTIITDMFPSHLDRHSKLALFHDAGAVRRSGQHSEEKLKIIVTPLPGLPMAQRPATPTVEVNVPAATPLAVPAPV